MMLNGPALINNLCSFLMLFMLFSFHLFIFFALLLLTLICYSKKAKKNGIPNKRKTELCCQHPLNSYTHLSLVPRKKKSQEMGEAVV